ncbi:MAG: MBL fold metallo-hydrolase [Candidatus Heimdallarchaeota archaeon]
MKITALGGVNEIGGNAFLLGMDSANLLLDFGRSFSRENIYFSGFLQPRTKIGLKDLLEFDIIPAIPELYAEDFQKEFPPKAASNLHIHSCFLSHAHIDHFGNLNLLNERIPVYMGETAKTIIQSIQETSRPRFGRPYVKTATEEQPSNVRTFRTGDIIQIPGVDVTPIHVDHSLPGSYGFIVEDRNTDITIGYSGDLRLHGWRQDLTEDFIKKARHINLNALLMEGTNVNEDFEDNEANVQRDMAITISETEGLVIANYSLRDIDRFRSIYLSAKATDRKLLIPPRQAHLLRLLQDDVHLDIPSLSDPHIEVYKRQKSRYYRWETSVFDDPDITTTNSPNFDQTEYIFHCDFWNLTDLIDIHPQAQSVFIYSHGDPFDEEGLIDFKRLQQWTEFFHLDFKQLHASGHAPRSDLKHIVESISPDLLIPIHSEHPDMYQDLTDIPLLLVTRGRAITI